MKTLLARTGRLALCLLAGFSLTAWADLPPLSRLLAGGNTLYTAQPGDTLIGIGARFGVSPILVAQQNAIPYPGKGAVRNGQRLRIHHPHIVPNGLDDGVLINIPQRMLFHFNGGRLIASYPVGLGKPSWPTPEGEFRIVSRAKDKTWIVPRSIQEEMRREGRPVLQEVPPGPNNPLGKHWLGLSLWGYGIHGTLAPTSIYQFRSHGCIRLHADNIAELFNAVEVSTPGRLIYQPVLLAVADDGRILLEVHRDIYNKGINPARIVRNLAEAHGLSDRIDWSVADAVVVAQDGVAREVGRAEQNLWNGET
jgi:L,D-transpeptidase ErfK/SrfK